MKPVLLGKQVVGEPEGALKSLLHPFFCISFHNGPNLLFKMYNSNHVERQMDLNVFTGSHQQWIISQAQIRRARDG